MANPFNRSMLVPLMAGILAIPSVADAAEPEPQQAPSSGEVRTELDAIGVRDKLAKLPNADTVKGQPVPGKVRTDVYAKLQVNPELREFLDFFVNLASSEEDQPAVEDLMMTVLERRGMRGHIRVQVLEVLRDYMPYRMAVADQELEAMDSGQRLALREKYLGEEQARLLFQ